MKKLIATGAAIVGLLAASQSASAETTLTVSSWAPPTHAVNAVIWPTWGKLVEKNSNGRIKVKIEYGLAPPPAQFDIVRDGAAEATWIFHGYNPGRYVATQLVELPGLNEDAESITLAYQTIYEKYLAKADEHKGVKVLTVMSHGPGVLHTRKSIGSLDEVGGLKIRLGGGVSGAVGKELGMVGVRVPAPKVYETVSSGVADGVMMPMETKKSFRLMEIAPHSVSMPGGFYYGSFAMILNKDFYDGLSAADKKAVDDASGMTLAKIAGKAWADIDKIGADAATKAGNTLATASKADQAKFAKIAQKIEADVVAAISKKGIDAKAALAELRKLAGK